MLMAMSSSERGALFRKQNPECAKEYRAKRKEYYKQLAKTWYVKNKELAVERATQWREENRDKVKKINLAHYYKHHDQAKQRYKQWAIENRGIINANVRRYELAKINRTPCWINKVDLWIMKEAYDLAAKRTKLLGFLWHVDHIIPLRGKTVSGLHVPSNLQVIPAVLNISKGNKFNGN